MIRKLLCWIGLHSWSAFQQAIDDAVAEKDAEIQRLREALLEVVKTDMNGVYIDSNGESKYGEQWVKIVATDALAEKKGESCRKRMGHDES